MHQVEGITLSSSVFAVDRALKDTPEPCPSKLETSVHETNRKQAERCAPNNTNGCLSIVDYFLTEHVQTIYSIRKARTK